MVFMGDLLLMVCMMYVSRFKCWESWLDTVWVSRFMCQEPG